MLARRVERSRSGGLGSGDRGVCVAGEIPPPAGEDAGVRDDALGQACGWSGNFCFGRVGFTAEGAESAKEDRGFSGATAGEAVASRPGRTLRLRSGQAASAATQSLGLWWGIVPILNDEIPQ